MNAVSPDDVVLKFPSQNRSIPPKAVKLLGYKKVTLEGDLKSLTQENRQEIQSLVLQYFRAVDNQNALLVKQGKKKFSNAQRTALFKLAAAKVALKNLQKKLKITVHIDSEN